MAFLLQEATDVPPDPKEATTITEHVYNLWFFIYIMPHGEPPKNLQMLHITTFTVAVLYRMQEGIRDGAGNTLIKPNPYLRDHLLPQKCLAKLRLGQIVFTDKKLSTHGFTIRNWLQAFAQKHGSKAVLDALYPE